MSNHITVGQIGEEAAARFLQSKGVRILDRNYRIYRGEIDLVGKSGNVLIFYEVKSRLADSRSPFLPEYNVTHHKQQMLRKVCQWYMREKRYPPAQEWRIDVISVTIDKSSKKAKIRHIENAVWGREYKSR